MTDEIPTAVWSGSFKFGDLNVRCHVLNDGRRVIDEESMNAIFECDEKPTEDQMAEFARWMKGIKV